MAPSTRVLRKRPNTSLTDNAELPVNETVDTAPPPSKRAALSFPAEVQADLDSSDDDYDGEEKALADDDEFGGELSPSEIERAIRDGEMIPLEDVDEEYDNWEDDSSENMSEDEEDEFPTAELIKKQYPVIIDEANVVRFWNRVRYMIEKLLGLVKGPNAVSTWEARGGITPQWFHFLTRVGLEYLMEVFHSAVPIEVQSTLGQMSFDVNDLLSLTSDWKINSPGVYLNVLTRPDIAPETWHRRYVGSANSKSQKRTGLWQRIKTYFDWMEKRNDPKKRDAIREKYGAHGKCCMEDDVQIQFVILAEFSQNTSPYYVVMWETLMTVLLQTFKSQRASLRVPLESYDWAESCQPLDLSNIARDIGLNNAWPIMQGVRRADTDRVCAHCGTSDNVLCYMEFDKPHTKMLCVSCHRFRRAKGVFRPVEEIHYCRRRKAYLKAKRESGTFNCANCNTDLADSLLRTYYEVDNEPNLFCRKCAQSKGIWKRKKARPEPKPNRCIACGFDRRIRGKAETPYRCSACKTAMNVALANFEKDGIKKRRVFKTREQIIAHYCRNQLPSSSS